MNEHIKESMCQVLLDRCGVDIDGAKCFFHPELCLYLPWRAFHAPGQHTAE